MKKLLLSATAITLAVIVSACSTMKNGQTQTVTVLTPGAENAKCVIENQDMKYLAYTGQAIEIMKSPHDLLVNCIAPGNREKTILVKRELDDWVFVNVANGFVLGATYDYFSRGAFDYPPVFVVKFTDVPVRSYDLPNYHSPDINQKTGEAHEYMGPTTVDVEERPSTSRLNKKPNLFNNSNFEDIESQYDPPSKPAYDPREEDK